MDKTSERVHNQTIDFTNKVYEELSIIAHRRKDLRYFNKDYNDKDIDENIDEMFTLLDEIYNSCIQKKINTLPNSNRRTLFPDIEVSEVEVHTPSPRTPKKKSNNVKNPNAPKKKKNNNIKVEITDDDKEPDVLETIMYSSDGETYESESYDNESDNVSDNESDNVSDLELTDFSDSEFEEITN